MKQTERGRHLSTGWAGFWFCLPWWIGFLALFVWPFVASVYWSQCDYDLINAPHWVGGENYRRLGHDLIAQQDFGLAMVNTAYYALLSVPLSIALGIGLAILLSQPVRGQGLFRTLVYLPSVIPVVAASVLWLWLLDPDEGMINWLLSWVGVPPQNWLNQASSAVSPDGLAAIGDWWQGEPLRLFGSKDALVLMSLWGVGNFVVIYLAAITDIPKSLYEAAELDGAGPWHRVRHITLPMLSPVIFFNLVMGLIRSIQAFTSVYILSEGTGEPGGSLMMVSLQLFLTAFADLEMGYASAMALVLFVGLVAATAMLFRTSRSWVHYRSAW